MTTITKSVMAVILMSFSLCGCSSNLIKELVKTPEVKNIQLSYFSIEDKQAVFDLELYNPNAFTLPINNVAGDIELNNIKVGSLKAESDKQLKAYGTQTVSVPLSLDPNSLLNAAQSVLFKGKANYQFNGQLGTSLGEVHFSKDGYLSAQEILSKLLAK